MTHWDVTVLLGELFVFGIRAWIALDTEAGAVDVMRLGGLLRHVVEMDGLGGNGNLSYDPTMPYWANVFCDACIRSFSLLRWTNAGKDFSQDTLPLWKSTSSPIRGTKELWDALSFFAPS